MEFRDQMLEAEIQRDVDYKNIVDKKINTIDKLTELNNSHRFFKRGTLAFENIGMHHHNQARQKF